AAALSDALGQQFVMENRPGANGNIGAGAAAKAAPDGYTFVVATLGPIVANKFMYKTMSYDPERAFAPVVLLGSSPLIIVGSPKIPPVNLRSEEHTSELQSLRHLVCRLLLEKKKT